ncbi:actin-histidine N-methyltransferase [Drosophila sulfurigaster albostrigata]|uniref:actin-histidine N-methyltransferase n=1 Tax=Drosophila sulfurigaster albostrigata TaxID=89887 RepID=UPI002D219E3A|nr:actin-histidine N-methyltransferase [Drosophila sulfurigaster albostrigata]
MGKNKRNAKHKATPQPSSEHNNNNGIRIPKLPDKDRRQLNQLAQSALEILQKMPTNPNEEWKNYVEVQRVLESMMQLERPLQRCAFPPNHSNVNDKARLAKMQAFNEWAKAGGVLSDAVEIAIFPGYGLGLRATRDIEAGEQVLSVPRQLMFSEEHLSEAERNIYSSLPQLTNLNLSYALVIEKMRGAASSWYPYINTLPALYNTVLYFSVEQMQQLRGTSVCSAALRQCRVVARQYITMYKCAYIQPKGSVDASVASMASLFTQFGLCYDLYRWAVSTVMTRQNLVPKEQQPSEDISALIPYWEMANNRHGKITSYYDSVTRGMACTAQEACRAGEQFFIYYGDRSNADALVHSGFVDTNNPKNYVELRLGLSLTDKLSSQRSRLLAQLNINSMRVLPAPEYISGELLAFVRVFNMSGDQLEHWCSNLERAVDLLHIDCALETDLETRTWQYLYQRLKLLIGVLEATLKETDEVQQLAALQLQEAANDEAIAKLEIDTMLLQYRQLERRILNDALLYVQERLKV